MEQSVTGSQEQTDGREKMHRVSLPCPGERDIIEDRGPGDAA